MLLFLGSADALDVSKGAGGQVCSIFSKSSHVKAVDDICVKSWPWPNSTIASLKAAGTRDTTVELGRLLSDKLLEKALFFHYRYYLRSVALRVAGEANSVWNDG